MSDIHIHIHIHLHERPVASDTNITASRIKKAIAVMKRADEHKSLLMSYWQWCPKDRDLILADTESELYAYGNRASFDGHIAISPEFQEDGGSRGQDGEPVFGKFRESDAIREWLGISNEQACELAFGDAKDIPPGYPDHYSEFYGKRFSDVTAKDVIEKLEELLARVEQS